MTRPTVDWRQFLAANVPRPAAPLPSYIAVLIELMGSGLEDIGLGLQRLENLIMTSASSTDALIQAATASLTTFATDFQTEVTTLTNDLTTAITDIQDVISNGGTVQPTTVSNLQAAVTSLTNLQGSFDTAVGQLDAAVNPPAPSGN